MLLRNKKISHIEAQRLLEEYSNKGYKIKIMPFTSYPNRLKIVVSKGFLQDEEFYFDQAGTFYKKIAPMLA